MKKTAKGATKRTSSKEKVARRKASGQVAVEKGRKFEDQVAELYRLLGAEVIQNVEISQKKVDILATFSHPVRHRVIVECKDEKRAVNANQRVMQFQGLLDLARKTGEADSAEIITRVPWGDAAKGFALRSGIMLLTYTEKFAKLLDLRFYLNGLIDKFEQHDPARPSEPPLGVYYVDLSAETRVRNQMKKIPILDSFLMDWLEDRKSRNHLAIFGEYGSGKTSFCQKLSHDLAQSYLRNSNSFRIPILLNLREFVDKLDIEAYITSFLDRECQVPNPKFHVFKAMNDTGLFLLIFDGFDEMAVKVTPETLEANLLEIEKLATSPNAKVLLTSRPEHFTTAREEEEALHPAINTLGRRNAEYEPVRILPWNSEQIELFLQRRVPLIKQAKHPWTYYRDRIRQIRGLSDLSQKPVLLDMIVKTLPILIESNESVDRPNLYKIYLREEIRRQTISKKRRLLLGENERLSLLEQLATELCLGVIPALTFTETYTKIDLTIKPPRQELEAYTRDFLSNSFLVRKGDEFRFSHKSILEYLAARKFYDEILQNAPFQFGRKLIEHAIIDFIIEMKPDLAILHR